MFHNMRRLEFKMSENEARNMLCNSLYGVLSTVGEDGYPYGVALNFVYEKDALYIHCSANGGHKIHNFNHSEKISFNIVEDVKVVPDKFVTNYKSVVIFGKIKSVNSKDEKIFALTKIIEKYSKDYIDSGLKYIEKSIDSVAVYKIEIEKITGKKRPNKSSVN